jgi:hypothetical protein
MIIKRRLASEEAGSGTECSLWGAALDAAEGIIPRTLSV